MTGDERSRNRRRFWSVFGAAFLIASCSYVGRGQSTDPPPATLAPSPTPSHLATPSAAAGFIAEEEAIDLLHQCGILGRVAAYFRIPDGQDIWDHFPEMLRAPEIEGAGGIFVAVYDDPVSGPFLGRPGVPRMQPTDVLCVITADAEPNIYSDVSRGGMTLPPGAYVAAPDEWLLPTPPPT